MNTAWLPSASLEQLKKRAKILARIRRFFAERSILEVETPIFSPASVTDPHIHSISAKVIGKHCYLQTSPEYAMKRLLCAGIGSIYQICKAFRQDETGDIHNPEFTLLEWYRLGFDHHDLMNEVDKLLQEVLQTQPADQYTYAEIFLEYLGINPHTAEIETLKQAGKDIEFTGELNKDGWLNLLISHCIEPYLGKNRPVFIYDFPASQAALARIRQENPPVASRFEIYYQGIELGNGFHELQATQEQRARFQRDLQYRENHGLPLISIDEQLLAALEHGLPDCAGVAIGIDRLVMLALKEKKIENVMSFEFGREFKIFSFT